MADNRVVTKELIGAEDITTGTGTVTQSRAGADVSISKLNAGNISYDGGEFIRDKLAKKIESVATVEALRLLDTTIEDERYIYLLGLTTTNDGGQGNFYWDAASTDADDGIDIIQVTGIATGRFIRFATTIALLTDSSGGTADSTVAAVSGSGADATINNNFADLAAKVNAILGAIEQG